MKVLWWQLGWLSIWLQGNARIKEGKHLRHSPLTCIFINTSYQNALTAWVSELSMKQWWILCLHGHTAVFSVSKLSSLLGRIEVLSAFASQPHSLSLAYTARVRPRGQSSNICHAIDVGIGTALWHLLFGTGENCWSPVAHGLHLQGTESQWFPCILSRYNSTVRVRIPCSHIASWRLIAVSCASPHPQSWAGILFTTF